MAPLARHYLLLIALAATVFFLNLGGPRLWDRDESLNARCTVEMLERGDWVVPYFNGSVRFMKPAAMYWFMMSAVAVFGPTEFAFRFWSAVAGVGSVLATYHIGRRLFNPQVGLWGAVVLATSLMFAVLSRAVKVDALLIFFDTMALLVFVHATFRPRTKAADDVSPPTLRRPGHYFPQSTVTVAAMFALMGAAVLGKGPVGLVLPTAAIGMFLLVMRMPADAGQPGSRWPEPELRWRFSSLALAVGWLVICIGFLKISVEVGLVALMLLGVHLFIRHLPIFRPFAPHHFLSTCWYMRPLTALVVAGAVILPWHLWVAARDFTWIEQFYWVNNVDRATQALEGHGGSALLYYPLAIAVGFVPWSMLLTPVLIGWVKRLRGDDPWRVGYLFLACWLGVYVVLFSIAQTKLPNYVAPAYPALALATACYLFHLRRATAASAAWWPQVAMGALAVTGIATAVGLSIAAQVLLSGDGWIGLFGLIPLAGGLVCFVLFRRGQVRAATVSLAVCAALLVTGAVAGVAQQVDRHQQIQLLLARATNGSGNAQIATYGYLEPTWVFYSGRNIRVFGYRQQKRLRAHLEARTDRYLITTAEGCRQIRDHLPAGVVELARVPYFLQDTELVLLGHAVDKHNVAALPAFDKPRN